MIKLKPGQKVILEDGGIGEVEEGDCLVEGIISTRDLEESVSIKNKNLPKIKEGVVIYLDRSDLRDAKKIVGINRSWRGVSSWEDNVLMVDDVDEVSWQIIDALEGEGIIPLDVEDLDRY